MKTQQRLCGKNEKTRFSGAKLNAGNDCHLDSDESSFSFMAWPRVVARGYSVRLVTSRLE